MDSCFHRNDEEAVYRTKKIQTDRLLTDTRPNLPYIRGGIVV